MKNIDEELFVTQGINEFKRYRIRELDNTYRMSTFSMDTFKKFLVFLKENMQADIEQLLLLYGSHGLSEYETVCIVHDLYYSWINKDSKSELQKTEMLNAIFPKKEEPIKEESIKVEEPKFRANPSKSAFGNFIWDILDSILPK